MTAHITLEFFGAAREVTGSCYLLTIGDKRLLVDGPFAETKELIAGYTLIQCRNRDEAMEWTRRFPNPIGVGEAAEIEVRQLYELEDFEGLTSDETQARFKKIGIE